MRNDVLELTLLNSGNLQSVAIKRGTLEVGPGHLSYVQADDAGNPPARTYIPLHAVERFRYINRQNER